MKRIIRISILIVMSALSAVSCVTTKRVAYVQDMKHGSQIELENTFEAVIAPYDELDVFISCFDTELAKPFNLRTNTTGVSGSGAYNIAYLVDQFGDIELPVLGKIHAAGLTRLKLQERVRQMLIDGNYINDPYVMVRFRSFKVFFLGANGGKVINVPNERCTFLEALAMSGDLSVYTNRKKIAVMREVNGQMTMRYLDPRSSKVFDDPYFMLQQNDFIITRNIPLKNYLDSAGQLRSALSIISTITSVASLVILFHQYNLIY